MKFKFLLASAVAIVGIAVYTLTLSFTHSAPLLSQLEALADGSEGGDGGNTGGESGEGSEGENPESGQSEGKYNPKRLSVVCKVTVIEEDLNGNKINSWQKEVTVELIKGCPSGTSAESCTMEDCSKVSSF